MVGFLIFSGLLTGFIQINIDGSVNAEADDFSSSYHVLDFNKNISQTTSLLNSVDLIGIAQTANDHKKTDKTAKMNAVVINKKTLIIKGFNESIDPALLKTIDLNIKNIAESSTTITPNEDVGSEIVPVVLDVDLSNDAVELVDSEGDISEYEVVAGDTLGSIAQKFNISVETILWANDLNSKSTIKVGQKLVILPVSGISYKVKSGDTIGGLAQRFNVSERDIVGFNQTVDNKLIIGETIIIPGGKLANNPKPIKNNGSNGGKNTQTSSNGSFIRPINGIKTQGIHGYNGIDFGAPIGTSVYAAASGVVTLIRGGDSWNGGYGNYIVIKHSNGTQTLYAHLDSIGVNMGQPVSQGQLIGRSGNTGRSTGPHLHFEVRGARNPF